MMLLNRNLVMATEVKSEWTHPDKHKTCVCLDPAVWFRRIPRFPAKTNKILY